MSKRTFDLIAATLLLLLCSPVILASMVALRVQGETPIFNLSPRVGRGGKPFHLVRFRTMRDATGSLSPEERLTRVGRFIRNYSLDDLPNLFNVLKGDLSMVGPRPTEPERIDLANADWQRILTVRPGCMSYAIWALATEFNASDPALKRRLEIAYVERQSLWFDLQMAARWLQKTIASQGNIKARGKRTIDG